MKRYLFVCAVGILTASGGTCFAQDDLDDVLSAQKKKAQRRVYSTPAQLDNQNLVVPTGPTEEEIELDRKLEALEKELDTRARENPIVQRTRPAISDAPTTQKSSNWLTPALLDQDESDALTAPEEASWVADELARQQTIRERAAALKEENELINKRFREEMSTKSISPSPLQTRAPSVIETFTPSDSLRPRTGSSTVSQPIRSKNAELFSPNYRGAVERPRTSITSTIAPSFGETSSEATSISWDDPRKPETLSPLERVRRSSPIFKDNPFAEDHMPNIKTSIWD